LTVSIKEEVVKRVGQIVVVCDFRARDGRRVALSKAPSETCSEGVKISKPMSGAPTEVAEA
jgi:hypothetical protein